MTPEIQKLIKTTHKRSPNLLGEHYRLALSIANKFATSPYTSREDLEQEALIALNECIYTYDENCGKTFASYAKTGITNRLKQFVCTNGSIIRPEFTSGYTKVRYHPVTFFGDTHSNDNKKEFDVVIDAFNNMDDDGHKKEFDKVRDFFYCLTEYEVSLIERFIDGYLWKEIAAMDGKSVTNISSRVKNIINKLRREINKTNNDYDNDTL